METSRVVTVVSKKVSKRAVVRNRIRRRITGILREEWATVTPGYDIVITVRDDVSKLAADQLNGHIKRCLDRLNLTTN